MLEKLIFILHHPVYVFCNNVGAFNRFVSPWKRIYGCGDSLERKIYNLIKSIAHGGDVSVHVSVLGDGRIYQYLRYKSTYKISAQDLNKKNLEYLIINFNEKEVSLVDSIFEDLQSDVLICNNILNSVDDLDRERYIQMIKANHSHFVFIGDKNLNDRTALGPDPIGSYGCKQFSTEGLKSLLEKHFDTVIEFKKTNMYFYWV